MVWFYLNLVSSVSEMMTMPVIANGGCGSKEHLKKFLNLQLFLQLLLKYVLIPKQNMGVLVNYLDENEITEIFNEL